MAKRSPRPKTAPPRPLRVRSEKHPRDLFWAAPIHFSPACHVFVILLAQPLHHLVGGLAPGERSRMATDDECLRYAHEFARLAGLTKHRNVRDQLSSSMRWARRLYRDRPGRSCACGLRSSTSARSPRSLMFSSSVSSPFDLLSLNARQREVALHAEIDRGDCCLPSDLRIGFVRHPDLVRTGQHKHCGDNLTGLNFVNGSHMHSGDDLHFKNVLGHQITP